MQAGNVQYRRVEDLPEIVPVFPLCGALLLPGGQMPLNIFEPRYLAMFDAALSENRVLGIIQPVFDHEGRAERCETPRLSAVGCLGRVTSFSETGDGRYITSLTGICRFRVSEELRSRRPYRTCRIAPFVKDLLPDEAADKVDREALLASFRAYLDANQLEADWASVERASNATLVNCLAMMSPFGPAEKQALLEAPDLKARAETLVAITEIALARDSDDYQRVIQ
ncbi:MAG: LON peptidase substrate-binding domain-containing protein [Pararhizobium sp.]